MNLQVFLLFLCMVLQMNLGISQPPIQNFDMIKIADTRGQGTEFVASMEDIFKYQDGQILADHDFKFLQVKQGIILVPAAYKAVKPDVKDLIKGIGGYKLDASLTGIRLRCVDTSCGCEEIKCEGHPRSRCIQCRGCCGLNVDRAGGIIVPKYVVN